MLMGVSHRSVLILGLVRSRLSTVFLNMHPIIPETNFWYYSKKVLSSITFNFNEQVFINICEWYPTHPCSI